MKNCPSCSKELPDAALHCVFCGAKQGPAVIAREYVKHVDPRIRTLAATLLGEIGGSEATTALRALLADENPAVQVAAAAGIDAVD